MSSGLDSIFGHCLGTDPGCEEFAYTATDDRDWTHLLLPDRTWSLLLDVGANDWAFGDSATARVEMSPVPEPGTAVLLLAGLCVVSARCGRRRR